MRPFSVSATLCKPKFLHIIPAFYDKPISLNANFFIFFPLFPFLLERQMYPDEQILESKIKLLNMTNTVDYAMDNWTSTSPSITRRCSPSREVFEVDETIAMKSHTIKQMVEDDYTINQTSTTRSMSSVKMAIALTSARAAIRLSLHGFLSLESRSRFGSRLFISCTINNLI
ncbi:hypothetical protein C1H46_000335 [Malus baccata]|uniref:Eukaryotic translation initiation factor 3 subunit E N-terminal domain-containing protein n=1 Tax=Malus baccata TaxID=106549 RepID=A0A540NSM8_MALBA|nr:hypothetical protein C1H46_000335 [Malus baccata]